MKNKHDGWSARWRSKSNNDRIAHDAGYANYRAMVRFRDINELKVLLTRIADDLSIGAQESRLFDTHAVAGAIGTEPKAVRWFVYTHQLASEPPRSGKSRKLFFSARSVHEFLQSRRTVPGREALRYATIVANPRSVGELGLTKNEVRKELGGIPKRAVARYLASGKLKRTAASSRSLTLITAESVSDLRASLMDGLIKARKKLISAPRPRRPRLAMLLMGILTKHDVS